MEKFIVSARKYRPTQFKDVVGQGHVTDTLSNSITSNRFAHAYLFCGPRGIGKTTCARILAKALNCTNLNEQGEPCNACESCTSFNAATSFNIYELDAASNSHVDDIRQLIDQVRFPPQSGKYKTYIIDEVHMLSASAFNAFLKTLEEPPEYAIFILATTEKNKILPTILSRCQIFDFYRITVADIADHLEKISKLEKIESDPDALHIIAQKADGSLRDALSIFDRIVSFSGGKLTYENVIDNLNILDYDFFFKATDAFLDQDSASLLNLFHDVVSRGFEGDDFIHGLGEHFRNLMVSKDPATIELLEVTGALTERYLQQSEITSTSFLMSALNILDSCDVHYKASKNKRLHVEVALLKLCYLGAAVDLARSSMNPLSEMNTELAGAAKKKDIVLPEKNTGSFEKLPGAAIEEKNTQTDQPENEKNVSSKPGESKESTSSEQVATPPEPVSEDMPDFRFNHSFSGTATDNATMLEPKKDIPKFDPSLDKTLEIKSLVESWNEFGIQLSEQGKDYMSSLMIHTDPVIVDKNSFKIKVANAVLKEHFNEEKTHLLEHLRSKLNNRSIVLKIDIDENIEDQKNILYTDRDKFKRLAEKNPLLNELKKRFDLEIDF